MEISLKQANDVVILELIGNLDVNASILIETVAELINKGIKKVACSFENVEVVDYTGLSGLAIAYKNAVNNGVSFKFFNVPSHIKQVFSLLLLDNVFEIYSSREQAIKSFKNDDRILRVTCKNLRRRFKRLPIKLDVDFKLKFAEKAPVLNGRLFNLSAIGAFIFCDKPLPIRDIIALWLPIGEQKERIQVDARIVWHADKNIQPQVSPGMGIEFYNIDQKTQKKIIEFVDKNLPRQAS